MWGCLIWSRSLRNSSVSSLIHDADEASCRSSPSYQTDERCVLALTLSQVTDINPYFSTLLTYKKSLQKAAIIQFGLPSLFFLFLF